MGYLQLLLLSQCFEMNHSKLIFVQEKMRSHLIECLENQKFCNFPFNVNTN